MRHRQIAIVSFATDLHALVIEHAFAKWTDVECHVVESDCLSGHSTLTWSSTDDLRATLPAKNGASVDIRDLDAIWWRRVSEVQQYPSSISDAAEIEMINDSCRDALLGMLLSDFRGTWINHPVRNRAAGNKLVQLRAALDAGLRVPRTLISQDPDAIRRFCEELDYNVVVKPLHLSRKRPLFTVMMTPQHLANRGSVTLCPAIYQEYISGTTHVRAQCFGERVHSALLRSQHLDWRFGRGNVDVVPFELPEEVNQRLATVLRLLGLEMGIVDLKLTPEGEPVWLEINPQGQFLFVEALGGIDLTSAFVEFLYERASSRALP